MVTIAPTPCETPSPGAEELLGFVSGAPEHIASVFRGAREWRNAREADFQAVIADAEHPGPDARARACMQYKPIRGTAAELERASTGRREPIMISSMGSERVRKVLAIAEQLEPEERAELADELWSTLPEALRGEDDLTRAEIERRLDDVHAGRDEGVDWGEAHASIRAELVSKPRR